MTTPALPKEIVFTYLKSAHFRVLRTDGAIVGPGPNGSLHMSLFSERIPIPNETVHAVGEGGKIGAEIQERRMSRGGIVREVDVDAVLTLEAAIAIRELLDKQIQAIQGALAAARPGVKP